MSSREYLQGHHEPDFSEVQEQREREHMLAGEFLADNAENDILNGFKILIEQNPRRALDVFVQAAKMVNVN